MPFISSTEFTERLNSPKNLPTQMEIIEIKKGRGVGREAVEPEVRKLIAGLATDPSNDDKRQDIAKAFGVSNSQVTAYGLGKTTPSRSAPKDEELTQIVNGNRLKKADIETSALDIIANELLALPEKMETIKTAKGKTNVLKDITAIMNGVNGKSAGDSAGAVNNSISLHLYAPKAKQISDYEVVEAEVR